MTAPKWTRYSCPSCGYWVELIDPDATEGHTCPKARRFVRFVKEGK